jgi:hypothetical protein
MWRVVKAVAISNPADLNACYPDLNIRQVLMHGKQEITSRRHEEATVDPAERARGVDRAETSRPHRGRLRVDDDGNPVDYAADRPADAADSDSADPADQPMPPLVLAPPTADEETPCAALEHADGENDWRERWARLPADSPRDASVGVGSVAPPLHADPPQDAFVGVGTVAPPVQADPPQDAFVGVGTVAPPAQDFSFGIAPAARISGVELLACMGEQERETDWLIKADKLGCQRGADADAAVEEEELEEEELEEEELDIVFDFLVVD